MNSEKKLQINRLFDLIANTNELLEMHKARAPKGQLQVVQYEELKARYEEELLSLLRSELGLNLALAA